MQRSAKTRILIMAGALCVLLGLVALGAAAMMDTQAAVRDPLCPIRISEIQAANGGCPDAQGRLLDWVELYNDSDTAYNLAGCGLSDDPLAIDYFFPDGTVLDGGAYLVVYCEKGASDGLTAPLGIARAGGETVCFFSSDDTLADSVKTVPLSKGEVYALAGGAWQVLGYATPGFDNTPAGREAYREARGSEDCPVVITELMAGNAATLPGEDGSFPDWIELTNTGKRDWDLTGYFLSQDEEDPLRFPLPAQVLAPGERLLLWCDGKGSGLHTSFTLSKSGESLYLTNPAGIPAGSVSWGALEDDEVWCWDEETGEYARSDTPSPALPNTAEGALAAAQAADSAAGLVISEVVSANTGLLRQPDGEYYDWVELYNGASAPVRLSDYTLSDDKDDPARFPLPEVELAPGAYYVVICSGDASLTHAGYVHAPFSLNAQDDRLYLRSAAGALQDFCRVRDIPTGGSLGRMRGERGWFLFDTPTPGAANTGALRGVAARPTSSVAQGVYEDVSELTVALLGEGEIRYTLDGSVPTVDSPVYKKPLRLTQTTVLRAVSVKPGSHDSPVSTFSYIINEGHSLPVLSIAVEPLTFFGKRGIYDVPNDVRDYREVAGSMAFFDDAGSAAADCGLCIHGASTRGREKKSVKMLFRARYDGKLSYDVFADGETTRFFSLTARAGYVSDGTLLRDEVCATAALDCSDRVLGLKTRYCVLYINGAYWGIYALREAYSAEYVASHLGTDKDTAQIERAPVRSWGGDAQLRALFNSLKTMDLTQRENYEAVCARVNTDSLIDWMILEAYFHNYDLPGNVRYIRGAPDDPWRYGFFDLDFGLRTSYIRWLPILDKKNQFGLLPTRLIQNEAFRDRLLTRMAELFAAGLCQQTVTDTLDAYCAQIYPELPRELERWVDGRGELQRWVDDIRANALNHRQQQCVDSLCRSLGLDADAVKTRYFGGMELE